MGQPGRQAFVRHARTLILLLRPASLYFSIVYASRLHPPSPETSAGSGPGPRQSVSRPKCFAGNSLMHRAVVLSFAFEPSLAIEGW